MDALVKLATWLSPAYPVGAYTYSHGLERAIEDGAVSDRGSLREWIEDLLRHGAGRTDATLLSHAWRDPTDEGVAELAAALQPSAERALETNQQGAAFVATTAQAWPAEGLNAEPAPYPVAVGRAARAHDAPLKEAATLYLHAFAANLVSAGVRLIPLGQTDGQRVVADLAPICEAVAAEATEAPLEAIGGAAMLSDIASMRHETQRTRLYRS